MDQHPYVCWMKKVQEFFNRSTSALAEEDSGFAPVQGMLTAAQHVAHVAQTIHWFIGPAFEGRPFEMDFQGMEQRIRAVTSLTEAREQVDQAFEQLSAKVAATSMEKMMQPVIPADAPFMQGMSPVALLSCIDEHTAHHRGSLAVYARLCGKQPPMPYMDDCPPAGA